MKPSTYRCLKLLRELEFVTTHDFLVAGCGSRFGARLAELRHEHGCVIEEHKLSDRSGSRYTLIAEPETSGQAGCGHASTVTSPLRSASMKQVPGTPVPNHAGIASARPGLITQSLPGATPGPAIPTREGDPALTSLTASTQARGSDSTGTDHRRERNGTFDAVRRPEPLTGQRTTGAGPLAGRLVDNAVTDRADVPASDAAPASVSRTDAAQSFEPSPSRPPGTSGEAPAPAGVAPSLLLADAAGQATTSGARCAIYDDDWNEAA